ncbi:MAG: DUF4215 domain-containing protein, partial [Candidatus Peribacter sp.]|nr:DUF4215 domain-containing protein [Candidatus Peribacter sp.]
MKHTPLPRRTVSLLAAFVACAFLAVTVHTGSAIKAATTQGMFFRVTVTKMQPDVVSPGSAISYEVKIKNISSRSAYATAIITAPKTFVFLDAIGWSSTCRSFSNGMVFCASSRIAASAEQTLILRYQIPVSYSCSQTSVALQVSVPGVNVTTQTDPLVCARCGDGQVQNGEQCDDANQVNTDACSNACIAARCGDGIKQGAEQCDDGNSVDNDACTNACAVPRCGDMIIQTNEECDDGNQSDADACSNACIAARCGDGVIQPPEQCDDGNTVENDACSTACVSARCGDSVLQVFEQCDDGNVAKGDGCSDRCFTETDLSVLQGNMYRTDRSGFGILTLAVFNNRDTTAQNVVFRASGFGTDDFILTAPQGCRGGGRAISCIIEELRGRDRRIFKVPVQLSSRYVCNQRGPSLYISVLQANGDVNPQDNIQLAQVVRDCTFRSSSSSFLSSVSSVSSASSLSSISSTSSSEQRSSLTSSVSSSSSAVSSVSSLASQASSDESSSAPDVSSASSAQSSFHPAASSSESSQSVSLSSSSVSSARVFSSLSSRISTPPAACGNAVREGVEECDDGNTVDGDACSKQCKNEVHLTVTLTGSVTPFKGTTQTYSGIVRNDGPAAANVVTVKIEMPSAILFVQNDKLSNCTLTDSIFGRGAVCSMGMLAPGAAAAFAFDVTFPKGYYDREGIIKVTANTTSQSLPPWSTYSKDLRLSVKSCGNGMTETDWQEQCDDGNAIDGDTCSKQCKNEVRLAVTLTGSLTPMKGSTQTYRGIVRNDGPAIAHGVGIRIKIPTTFAFAPVLGPVNCTVGGSSYERFATCPLDSLNPGASTSFAFDVIVPTPY